ncbi:AEC family transporter [Pseudolysinimonas sp.]|uniref:AEC family transporter n=1 Tax=Pseudolysinimonas sp. TaxID=2680009 RepID=UPI003F81DE68
MAGVLIGFAIIAVVIGAGYLIARIDLLGPTAQQVLTRLAFFVLIPSLLFTTLATADLHRLFSSVLPVSAICAVVCMGLVVAVGRIWRRPVPETTVAGLGAGYVNANNIGLPVSAYILGDATSSVPVILLQVILLAPIALAVLDVSTSGRFTLGRILLQPVKNPLILASLLGLVINLAGIRLPTQVLQPFTLVGAAAVPVVLLSFGISLRGRRPLAAGSDRRLVILAVTVKTLLMPAIAWAVGAFVFHLEGHALFVVVVLAALPSAQNVFNYAQRYGRGAAIARDVVLLTTGLSLPAMFVIAALLAPR